MLEKLVPFQYLESLTRWMLYRTVARPLRASLAVPQKSPTKVVEQPAFQVRAVYVVPWSGSVIVTTGAVASMVRSRVEL